MPEAATQMVFPTGLDELLVPIDQLIPYPDNARQGDVDMVAESLTSHGMYTPVTVQRSTNYILVGNHRWKAAKQLGWTKIAAIFLDCDDEEARAINLVDNRASDVATYDWDQLLDSVRKAREARQRHADEIAGQQGFFDGFGEDGYEDLVARAGEVGAVAIEQFRGDYQVVPEGEVKTEPTEAQIKTASAATRTVGMKEIVLILTTEQYDAWVAKIKECMAVWGCKSGSEAAVQLIQRAPHFGEQPKGLDGHGPGYD